MNDKPRLQNIPLRTEYGKQVHEAFKARTKHLHSDVDYEALEKRMAAEACRAVIGLDGIRDTFKICVQQLRDTKGTHDATVHRKAVIELSKFILAAEGRASRVDTAMGGREKRYDAAWSRWNHQSCYHHLPPNSWEHLHAVRWANRRANERSDFIWSNV